MQGEISVHADEPPFRLGEIDHVVLRAHDATALADFYVEIIGCYRERIDGDLIQLRAGRALIDIVPRGDDAGSGRNIDHVCLTVTPFDAETLRSWFAARGIATGDVAIRYGAGGYGQSIYLSDPEGNGIELKAVAS